MNLIKEPSNDSLNIGFAGSHTLSWFCLKAIAELCKENGDQLKIVYNVIPEIGKKYSAYQEFDKLQREYKFDHKKVTDIDCEKSIETLKKFELDILFIIGWHKIVSQEVINTAKYCIGMHTSLLPKDRGSAPVNWQIIRQEEKGGITLFHLTSGVDTGDLVAQREFKIETNDTCKDIHERSIIGALDMLRKEWNSFKAGTIKRELQNESLATLNTRRKAKDGKIDWHESNINIDALIRATTNPYPGAFGYIDDKKVILWSSTTIDKECNHEPGTIIKTGEELIIATGSGYIKILRLNYEDEPESNPEIFSLLYNIKPGKIIS